MAQCADICAVLVGAGEKAGTIEREDMKPDVESDVKQEKTLQENRGCSVGTVVARLPARPGEDAWRAAAGAGAALQPKDYQVGGLGMKTECCACGGGLATPTAWQYKGPPPTEHALSRAHSTRPSKVKQAARAGQNGRRPP